GGQRHLALQHALAVAVVGVDHAVLLHRQAGLLARRIAAGAVGGDYEVGAVLAGVAVVDGDVHRVDAGQGEADVDRAGRRGERAVGAEDQRLRAADGGVALVVIGIPGVVTGLDEILGQGVFLALGV